MKIREHMPLLMAKIRFTKCRLEGLRLLLMTVSLFSD